MLALALAFVYHGGLLVSGTFKHTYDAWIHIFFADHYARAWFDHWDYRWYTGFAVTSYPPGSQQSIALISPLTGLVNGFIVVQLCAVLLVVVGVYRFSQLWVGREAAGYAALLTVFSSSICETVHVFGQLPTIYSLGFLLNALPYVRRWLDSGDPRLLAIAWLCNAATTAAHHVTTLFGAIFFVLPVVGSAIVDALRTPLPDEPPQHPRLITRANLRPLLVRRLRRILPVCIRSGVYLVGLVFVLLLVVLPYWLWSKADPISQVPIPHASRDSFIANPNAGLVFWLIPYGLSLLALPYIFYRALSTRAWPLGLSLALLVMLGTGGTTPLPRLLLRSAFTVLTLDRFTFWATICLLPLLGEFVVSLRHRGLATYLRGQFGPGTWYAVQVALLIGYLGCAILAANFAQFRRFQPGAIEMAPIVSFLDKDQHSRWRYLTLGFGDQMAWLSAQTTATTVDGDYHSARRLPELTSTPVERLEGAKFRGIPGLGSLQQFLGVPEKYNLKFVFSNDPFYDPLLFFSGWHRLQRLENGIMVWERADIPPLPAVLPRREIPAYQRAMWGIVPISAIFGALLAMLSPLWSPWLGRARMTLGLPAAGTIARRFRLLRLPGRGWAGFDRQLRRLSHLPPCDEESGGSWQPWRAWIARLPRPRAAAPGARRVRSVALLALTLAGCAGGLWYLHRPADPSSVVLGYYDDLDFRRFGDAYGLLDPATRPSYDQYLLSLSVQNGLLASYGKLESVVAHVLSAEPDHATVRADTLWVTALTQYPQRDRLDLVRRVGRWYIEPASMIAAVPPDEFFRRAAVDWHVQGRRQVTTGTTAFGDILDRPLLRVLSARLIRHDGRYSVAGEVLNTDVNPADLTVTASLFDAGGGELSRYDGQTVAIHALLPKELTPFRVDFEGVAGAALSDAATAGYFRPGAYSPLALTQHIASFEVYAKAVVTDHDLYRDVGAQALRVGLGGDGLYHLTGTLRNTGTLEATIPHLLATLYDARGAVSWVDDLFVAGAVRPQGSEPFDLPITPPAALRGIAAPGRLYANGQSDQVPITAAPSALLPMPPDSGYASLRLSVGYFAAGGQ